MAKQTNAYIALAFICIVWGTTYLAIRVGVIHFKAAILFAGIRQTIAGILLMFLAIAANKSKDFSGKNIARQALIGFLMLSLGNGAVTWGEKYIPSGIAALICSMMPIFAVSFNLISSKKERLNFQLLLGMFLGSLGVGMIFKQDLNSFTDLKYIGGILAVLFATASWALGSIINKKGVQAVNPFLNSGMQLFFGGIFMLIASPAIDNLKEIDVWNRDGLLSLGYLIIFGSVLSYAAYMFALSKLPVGIATIYAYVNPLVAVVLGCLILGEKFNEYTIVAFVTIILGVYLVNKGYRSQHQLKSKIIDSKETFPENIPLES